MSYIKQIERGEIYELQPPENLIKGLKETSTTIEEQGAKPIKITASQKQLCSQICRTVFITTYYPLKLVKWLLDGASEYIEHYCLAVHDKDTTENGEPKKTHIHILIKLVNNQSIARLCSMLHTVEVRKISTKNVKHEYDYLIHDSERCRKENKYQYPPESRISDDFEYWKQRCIDEDENDKAVSMFDDFSKGTKPRDMIKKYGFSYLTYYKSLSQIYGDDKDLKQLRQGNIRNALNNAITDILSAGFADGISGKIKDKISNETKEILEELGYEIWKIYKLFTNEN